MLLSVVWWSFLPYIHSTKKPKQKKILSKRTTTRTQSKTHTNETNIFFYLVSRSLIHNSIKSIKIIRNVSFSCFGCVCAFIVFMIRESLFQNKRKLYTTHVRNDFILSLFLSSIKQSHQNDAQYVICVKCSCRSKTQT